MQMCIRDRPYKALKYVDCSLRRTRFLHYINHAPRFTYSLKKYFDKITTIPLECFILDFLNHNGFSQETSVLDNDYNLKISKWRVEFHLNILLKQFI